jgi:hypothetical protein
MKPKSRASAIPLRLDLTVPEMALSRYFPMLGQGFLVKGPGGEAVAGFLQKAVGISAAYLMDRVQTVFLNGKALDDFKTAAVGDGATLALSAAMPGLAGAVLRRGGFYAAMRRQISHEADGPAAAGREITVILKLFNLVARELGPGLLERGILIPADQLRDFIERQGRWLWEGCIAVQAEERPVRAPDVLGLLPEAGRVMLTVKAARDSGAAVG